MTCGRNIEKERDDGARSAAHKSGPGTAVTRDEEAA